MLKAIGALVVAIIIAMGVVKALDWFRNRAEDSEGEEK